MRKNRIVYSIILILSFIGFVATGRYGYFTLFIFLIGGAALSLIMMRLPISHLQAEMECENQFILWEKSQIQFNLSNASRVPFFRVDCRLTFDGGRANCRRELNLSSKLDGNSQLARYISCTPGMTGIVKIAVTDIYVYDFLGIFRKAVGIDIGKEVSVIDCDQGSYHRESDPEGDSYSESSFTEYKIGNDRSEPLYIGDYQGQEPLSAIDWKLSVKYDKALVRKYGTVDHIVSTDLLERKGQSTNQIREEDLNDSSSDGAIGVFYSLNENIRKRIADTILCMCMAVAFMFVINPSGGYELPTRTMLLLVLIQIVLFEAFRSNIFSKRKIGLIFSVIIVIVVSIALWYFQRDSWSLISSLLTEWILLPLSICLAESRKRAVFLLTAIPILGMLLFTGATEGWYLSLLMFAWIMLYAGPAGRNDTIEHNMPARSPEISLWIGVISAVLLLLYAWLFPTFVYEQSPLGQLFADNTQLADNMSSQAGNYLDVTIGNITVDQRASYMMTLLQTLLILVVLIVIILVIALAVRRIRLKLRFEKWRKVFDAETFTDIYRYCTELLKTQDIDLVHRPRQGAADFQAVYGDLPLDEMIEAMSGLSYGGYVPDKKMQINAARTSALLKSRIQKNLKGLEKVAFFIKY